MGASVRLLDSKTPLVYTVSGEYILKIYMKKKYMRLLVSLPDATYKMLTQNIPAGKRSGYIAKLIVEDLPKKQKKEESFWLKLSKMHDDEYSHEDPVKLAKHAWDEIIDRY